MQPDFSKPAFSLVALASLAFESTDSAREYHSDYRCQLRFERSELTIEARVYFVGCGTASAGARVPVVVAFLEPDRCRGFCVAGAQFALVEGERVTARGVIDGVATR